MINREQLIARKNKVGSSDSPCIVGVNPWQSIADVYISKTQDLAPIVDHEAIEIGNMVEHGLAEWASRETGIEIVYDVHVDAPDNVLAANLDARGKTNKRVGFEVKSSSNSKDYGAPLTDEIPDYNLIQCQHQMFCADLDLIYVPVLLSRFDRLKRELYVVKRNEDLIKAILEADYNFWYSNVLPKIPPPGILPAINVLSRVIREPGTSIDINRDILARYQLAQDIYKRAETLKDKTKAELLALSGDAEILQFGDETYSYYEQERSDIDSKRLKLAQPELWKHFVNKTKYRVLRKIKGSDKLLTVSTNEYLLEN